MHCKQRHLIGQLNDKDKVRKVPREEIIQIVSAIRSDSTMKDAEICEKAWFKQVQQYML